MFSFHEPGPLIDNDLELRLAATIPLIPAKDLFRSISLR